MTKSPKRRMVENEVIFRQYNEGIKDGFEEIKRIAKEDHQEHLIDEVDTLLHFYCECSDENCRKRIIMRPSRYETIHKKRARFIVLNGHEAESIERIIAKESDFYIVEKTLPPPAAAAGLNATALDNA